MWSRPSLFSPISDICSPLSPSRVKQKVSFMIRPFTEVKAVSVEAI